VCGPASGPCKSSAFEASGNDNVPLIHPVTGKPTVVWMRPAPQMMLEEFHFPFNRKFRQEYIFEYPLTDVPDCSGLGPAATSQTVNFTYLTRNDSGDCCSQTVTVTFPVAVGVCVGLCELLPIAPGSGP
jgi:hypothetical protein